MRIRRFHKTVDCILIQDIELRNNQNYIINEVFLNDLDLKAIKNLKLGDDIARKIKIE